MGYDKGLPGTCAQLPWHRRPPPPFIGSHFLDVGSPQRRFAEVHDRWYRDSYGVAYDTSVDKDIGTPVDWPLKEPRDLEHYRWPDPGNSAWFAEIPTQLAAHPDRFSRYKLGFTLYERAWSMRGMPELLIKKCT